MALQDYLTATGIVNKKILSYEIINGELYQKELNTPFIVSSKISTESLTTKVSDGQIGTKGYLVKYNSLILYKFKGSIVKV